MYIKYIHDVHMDISYNTDHPIYHHLTQCVRTRKGSRFLPDVVIPTNKYGRVDFTQQIITKKINITDLNTCKLDDDTLGAVQHAFSRCTKDRLTELLSADKEIFEESESDLDEESLQYVDRFYSTVSRLIEDYGNLLTIDHSLTNIVSSVVDMCNIIMFDNDRTCQKDPIILLSTIYFLGMLEWFHLLILRSLINSRRTEETLDVFLMIGDAIDTDPQLLCNDDLASIGDFYLSEYCSHSIVYVVSPKNMFVFDPDQNKCTYKTDVQYAAHTKIANTLGVTNITYDVMPKVGVQSITDDQYCVFHCINFIFKYTEFLNNVQGDSNEIETVRRFMSCVEKQNKKQTTRSVRDMIVNLNESAKLFMNS